MAKNQISPRQNKVIDKILISDKLICMNNPFERLTDKLEEILEFMQEAGDALEYRSRGIIKINKIIK